MKRILFILTCAAAICAHAVCAGAELPDGDSLMHFKYKGSDREYRLVIPDNLNEARPLVMMMHGYKGKADPDRFGMRQAALRHGFAICFPQGAEDTTGRPGWNVGYPAQKGMKTDDVASVVDPVIIHEIVGVIVPAGGGDRGNRFPVIRGHQVSTDVGICYTAPPEFIQRRIILECIRSDFVGRKERDVIVDDRVRLSVIGRNGGQVNRDNQLFEDGKRRS